MKTLITGGCSFSYSHRTLNTWNTFLEDDYDNVLHTGVDGANNDYISRLVTHKLLEARKETPYSTKIDVVVLWSGISRKLYTTTSNEYINQDIMLGEAEKRLRTINLKLYTEDDIKKLNESNAGQHKDIQGNTIDKDNYAYNYFLPSLEHKRIEEYYKKFTNEIDDWEKTTFNILNLQELCKANNANFSWGHYDGHYAKTNKFIQENCEHVAWGLEKLDLDKCFCFEGMTSWVRENFVEGKGFLFDKYHPSQIAHKHFAKSIIKPFITNPK